MLLNLCRGQNVSIVVQSVSVNIEPATSDPILARSLFVSDHQDDRQKDKWASRII